MPLKHAIKVSKHVYIKLKELAAKWNLESPNQVLEKLLKEYEGETPTEFYRETLSKLIDGKYYVICKDCGGIAHLVVEYNGESWYYCPRCNVVFRL